jgi:long-chain acyl-CoA synthetase
MGCNRPFPWEASYPAGVGWDVEIVPGTLRAVFDTAVATYPDHSALAYGAWRASYAELDRLVSKAARGLASLGLRYGGRVALYLPNTPWHPVFFFAAMRTGITIVHLSPLDAERELIHKLTDSGARTIVTTDLGPLTQTATKLVALGHAERVIVGEDGFWRGNSASTDLPSSCVSAVELLKSASAQQLAEGPRVQPDDIALLQYTGGTTGRPRAAMLTHANIAAAIDIYAAWGKPQGLVGDGTEKLMCVLPLFHIFALTAVLVVGVHAGAEIVLHPRFDANAVLDDIERRRITSFSGVPTMWIAIANLPGLETRDLSSLKSLRSGGAPCPVEIEKKIERLTGLRLGGGWGMTETAPAGTNIPAYGAIPHGSIGLPLPGIEMDVVALDDPRRVLGVGETGEIRIKGPNVVAGYLNRAEESASTFAGGWLLTGDVGYMDDRGFFFIVDRKNDMILSGGFNVYPRMIEEAIYEYPGVAECSVIGVPDAYRGEAAKAFVTLKPGAREFTLDELRTFLADKLGRHELPAHLEFRASLPRTAVGKLSKKELIAEARSGSPGPRAGL